MEIWIFQTGEPTHLDKNSPRPMRSMKLSKVMSQRGHKVVIWAAKFDHTNKIFREVEDYHPVTVSPMLEYRFIPSTGYYSNLSIGRLLDHFVLARNLRKVLQKQAILPDLLFIGFPPIEFAFVAAVFGQKKNLPVIIDAKDQWPDLFYVSTKNALAQTILKFSFYPLEILTQKTFRIAAGFSSVTDSYIQWMNKKRGQEIQSSIVCRTAHSFDDVNVEEFEDANLFWDERGVTNDGTFRLFFVGSFMSVFDFSTVAKCFISLLKDDVPVELIICGKGHLETDLDILFRKCSNVKIFGWINQAQLKVLSLRSKCSLVPYKDISNYRDNIPNKINDSIQLGIPFICPIQGVISDLIDENGVGFKYQPEDALSLTELIRGLVREPEKIVIASEAICELRNATSSIDDEYDRLADWLCNYCETK